MQNGSTTPGGAAEALSALAKEYPFAACDTCGQSMLGAPIAQLSVGEGDKQILFLGGMDGTDGISEQLLLLFAADLCRKISIRQSIGGINREYLLQSRRILILPRINPDGRALVLHGPDPSSPLYERQLRQNGMKADFSAWRGNARAVILQQNFNDDFARRRGEHLATGATALPMGEFPESEPESAFVARLVRLTDPASLIELAAGDGCLHANDPELVTALARMSGFTPSHRLPCGAAAWFGATFRRPSCLITCPEQCKPTVLYGYLHKALSHLLHLV